MKIFTIIVTYNALRHDWIVKCLTCLSKSSVPTVPVIVDNCSKDGTVEAVRLQFPDATILPQERNMGFGQGNNIGIRYALENGADYVLLLNQDAYLQSDALEKMLRVSDGKSLLSPMQMNGDGSDIDGTFMCALKQADPKALQSFLAHDFSTTSFEANDMAAACWLMPRYIIDRIGGFNPLFFQYGEDNQYIQRLQYHGIARRIVTDAQMWHDRGEHGCMEVFNASKKHRDFLWIVCDPRKTWLQMVPALGRLLARYYWYELARGTYRIGVYSRELFWVIRHLREIRERRREEKV